SASVSSAAISPQVSGISAWISTVGWAAASANKARSPGSWSSPRLATATSNRTLSGRRAAAASAARTPSRPVSPTTPNLGTSSSGTWSRAEAGSNSGPTSRAYQASRCRRCHSTASGTVSLPGGSAAASSTSPTSSGGTASGGGVGTARTYRTATLPGQTRAARSRLDPYGGTEEAI